MSSRGAAPSPAEAGLLALPDGEPTCAVLVLAGSSGRVESDRVTLPGERAATGGATMARGGEADADARLGSAAWERLRALLGLHPPAVSERVRRRRVGGA